MASGSGAAVRGASRPAEDGAGEEGVSESVTKQIFASYVCRSSCEGKGVLHPGDIAEAGSLSAVPLPKTDHPLWDALPAEVVASGKLSQLQLEGVLYACAKHQQILPSGERAGFMIGDGAGVGKGRQIAGVIIDNWARGRRRHVWLSISTDLHLDAERDFRDLGCYIQVINNCQTLDRESKALGLSKDFKEGVLFMTYATLIGNSKGRSRLQQVIDWLGGDAFDGCIVFDECHKAKNFTPGKESGSTKAASCAIELQARLPMARVLYCSATGVSEVGNMAYMVRMGLFGPATAFPDFQSFLDSMKKRGVSFMEMLAMEMKAEGKYVARGLSFKDAEFVDLEAPLTERQVAVYDASAALWQALRGQLELAIARCTMPGDKVDVWRPFWSAQQRFFKLLCISMKIPTVVAEAKAALAAGQCVVIGLQTTGEASTDSLGLVPGPCPGFVSTCSEMLTRFIVMNFPTRMTVSVDERRAGGRAAEGADAQGQFGGAYGGVGGDNGGGALDDEDAGAAALGSGEEIEDCVAAKEALLRRVEALELPANFLDVLIDELGGVTQVAELTGRHGRIVRDGPRRLRYELRAKPESSEMDSLNVKEREQFMKGAKLVAIISDAASTGISLHASRGAANTRRRVHITIELPWSADKAIQQLGRSHRSNQVTGPIYKLVSTRIGGEKRFAAAVARRLQSLGALTRGDRRAASGIDLSEQNFDSPLGRRSLRRMYDHVVQDSAKLPAGVSLAEIRKDAMLGAAAGAEAASLFTFEDASLESLHIAALHATLRDYCDVMGIGLSEKPGKGDTVTEDKLPKETGKDSGDVRRFLNRILGLPVLQQNLLFNYFAATLTAEIRAAKAEGKYSEGLADLYGTKIQLLSSSPLWKDPASGLQTVTNTFNIDRGLSYEDAVSRLSREAVPGDGSGFCRSRRALYGRPMVMLALHKLGSKNTFHISRPNTGDSYFDIEREELEGKYQTQLDAEDVKEQWNATHEAAVNTCIHGPNCALGRNCTAGLRMTQVTILSGSVVRVWGGLEAVLVRHETELSKMDRTMRVVRVELDGGRHLVGVRFPSELLSEVVALLSTAALTQQQLAVPAQAGGALGLLPIQSLKARVEPPAPIDKRSLSRAFTKPKTIQDFFKPTAAKPASGTTSLLPVQPRSAPAASASFIDMCASPSGVEGDGGEDGPPPSTSGRRDSSGGGEREAGGPSGRNVYGVNCAAGGLDSGGGGGGGGGLGAARATAKRTALPQSAGPSAPPFKKVAVAAAVAAVAPATLDLFSVLRQGAAAKRPAAPAPKAGSGGGGAKGGNGGRAGKGGGGAGKGGAAASSAFGGKAGGGGGGTGGALSSRQLLLGMGFAADQVDRALREAGGSEQRAVELCLGSEV